MAKNNSTNSEPASQTAAAELAECLAHHASNNIHNPAADAVGDDMRAAARVVRRWWGGVHKAVDDICAGLMNLVEGA